MMRLLGFFVFCILTSYIVYQSEFIKSEAPNLHSNGVIDYWADVKPILDNRCVVCHGCYDAPCQLKLEAPIGLERGASKVKVYADRILAIEPERLFEDEKSVTEWRSRGFYPVLNEHKQTLKSNRDNSLLYQMLKLKSEHPLNKPLLGPTFDLSLNRSEFCPKSEQFTEYKNRFPQWGMPFGLPKLADKEEKTLMRWVEHGANYGADPSLHQKPYTDIAQWETFLNGASLKQQLISRYIYEHLYFANIYFPGAQRDFYRLVRSSTPPNQPLKKISTRRPYDDPGVNRVFYRLERYPGTILVKNHMPYRFDAARIQRFKQLFLGEHYTVKQLPSYDLVSSSNPFVTFKDLPVKSRYEFMLDEAQFTIMGFIKGAVCRGHLALDVINDHFWVVFENPNNADIIYDKKFLAKQSQNLRLPASDGSSTISVTNWHYYASLQQNYLKAKTKYIDKLEKNKLIQVNLDSVWNGENDNKNAALTIFRHYNSATVVKGFVGDKPKTAWLIDYPLLERLHYLLVAGFDVYGNFVHQLETRLYMDFLRMQGEANFLALLPKKDRKKIHHYWYRNAEKRVQDYIYTNNFVTTEESEIVFKTDDVKSELFDLLNKYIGDATNNRFNISENTKPEFIKIKNIEKLKGIKVSLLPQVTMVLLSDSITGEQKVFSLINNSAYSNISHLFNEKKRRLYNEDTLTVVRGFLGSYPNAFFSVNTKNLDAFIADILSLSSQSDYFKLKSKYGVRRTDVNFWAFSDVLLKIQKQENPIIGGLLDYNRLENR